MKRIICVLLALLLLVPVPVSADGGGGGSSFETTEDITPGGNPDIGGDIDTDKILPPGYSAYDGVAAAKKDEQGRYISGGYLYLKKEKKYSGSARVDYQMYTYSDITAADGLCLYVVHDSGNDGYYVRNVASFMYMYQWTSNQYPGSSQGPDLMTSGNCGSNLIDMALERWVVVSTNLPIFDINDTEAIDAYVNNGDASGAKNKDALDYVEASPDDTIVRPEVNIINAGDFSLTDSGTLTLGNVSVGWQTEQEGDYYDLGVRAYFYLYKDKLNIDWGSLIAGTVTAVGSGVAKDMKGAAGGIAEAVKAFGKSASLLAAGLGAWSSNVSVKADSSGSSTYAFTTNEVTKYINDYLATQPNCSDYFISKFEVRVRRRIGSKYSKWRVVIIDYTKDGESSVNYETRDDKDVVFPDDTGSDSDSYSTEDFTVDVYGGNGSGDIVINIDNSNENSNTNTNTNNNANDNGNMVDQIINNGGGNGSGGSGIDWDFIALLNFVKAGFGLLGNTGFIALLSTLFPFLPSEIFTIITIGVSVAVIIMIVNAVKRLFS